LGLGLLARVALDTLVSAPPLWTERLEETMKGRSADRRWGFWLADHGLAMGGLARLPCSTEARSRARG
jgi:hypothetical protein